jgi:diguanylate cyclase (GGDEF)-like protein
MRQAVHPPFESTLPSTTPTRLVDTGMDQRAREGTPTRLRETIGADLASAFAGDRAMSATEAASVREQQATRGAAFYSDMIYAVSHHYIPHRQAEALWNDVLSHKQLISAKLERSVGIAVAMLDFLSNIRSDLKMPTLISEANVAELFSLSMRDGMTGLFNHSTCYELLELELTNHRRYGVGVALLALDVDDFKHVNDKYGHQQGDRVLVELAKVITHEARSSDICCRVGGDEFVVILRLPNDAAHACGVAERIRAKAASESFGGMRITISAGVALCDGAPMLARELMARADRALYAAKMRGRNCAALDAGSAPNPLVPEGVVTLNVPHLR